MKVVIHAEQDFHAPIVMNDVIFESLSPKVHVWKQAQQRRIVGQSSLHFDPLSRTLYTDDRYLLVRQGSEDNEWVRMTGSFSFPPGDSETIRAEVECRG